MSFEEDIKSWVTLDNKIKQINEEVRGLREKRNNLTLSINTFVESNDLKHATVQISDGKLKFQSVKVNKLITEICKRMSKHCIGNEEQVNTIMEHIKTNREQVMLRN